MGGKNSAPPPPDYSALIAASKAASDKAYQMSETQFNWAKEQYAADKAINDQVVQAGLTRQQKADEQADKDRARYENTFQPLEDSLAADATSFASQDRQDAEAARAGATVGMQFNAQRSEAARALESYGVDPTSTRAMALDAGSRIAEAAAMAGAQNKARLDTEDRGRALRTEAINVGRGYPGQVAVAGSTALQSGNQAANTELATTASGGNTMGTSPQWYGLGNGGLGAWSGAVNQNYSNQLAQYNANQNASTGIGGALGGVLGLMTTPLGGTMLAGLEDGGDPGDMAIPDGTPGGPVPRRASPSAGAIPDDVDAKLTAGEFVVPKDVVMWKGQEHFQKLIEGSRKQKMEATAKPRPVPGGRGPVPAFVSRPAAPMVRQASAIPM